MYDVAVIGGGVVGCATLSQLTNQGYKCILLEKNSDLLAEASSGNSGMLHTGFDAQEDGHEAECIRYTQGRVFGLLNKLGVPVRKLGATMVAWTDQQRNELSGIIEKCKRQKFSAVALLSPSQVHQQEPYLQGLCKGGLWIPGEAVTDSWLFPLLLANDAKRKGAKISLNAGVESCTLENKGWCLQTSSGTLEARTIVNCGGLQGDKVDLLGGVQNFTIRPRKGQYLVYNTSAKSLINSSILPVPTSLGKGIIVFRSVYDNVVVGPTAEDVSERGRAPIDDAITRRLYDVTKRIVPKLTSHPVVRMYTGVRPATEYKDYVIKADVERKWITAGGIRSTGVSGCLGIAAKVNDLVEKELRVEPTRGRSFTMDRPEVRILNNGVAAVDGSHYRITHPLSYLGLEANLAKL